MAIEPEQKTPPLNERRITVPPMLPAEARPSVYVCFLLITCAYAEPLVIAWHLAVTYSIGDAGTIRKLTNDEVGNHHPHLWTGQSRPSPWISSF